MDAVTVGTEETAQTARYAAFISYRHVEPDRRWAKWLHRALETYRLPKRLAAGRASRLGRVFRDEEEVSASSHLSVEIDNALRESAYLIVVCSPRTPDSEWVNKEVVQFRAMGREDRILALLIEGEPSEAFPRSLREIRRTIADASSQTREEIEETEPLAADVRARPDEGPRLVRRTALLRLVSTVVGCRFDDLRRRERERQRRRIAIAGTVMLAVIALLAGLSLFAFKQKGLAEDRATEVVRERDARGRALDDVLRLADSKRIRDLVDEVDRLWPLEPSRADAMATWIGEAAEVLANRDGHRARLARIREGALPYTDEAKDLDHAEYRRRIEAGKRRLEEIDREAEGLEGEDAEAKRKALAEQAAAIREEVARLQESLAERRTWSFADPQIAWQHQVLVDLLAGLDALDGGGRGEGALSQVERRHVFVTLLEQRSLKEHAAAWKETIEAIAASPKYGGLEIVPQLGLVPLGPDPDSGLFEFAQLGSGSIPTRDEKTKQLVYAGDAAIVLVLIPGGTFEMGAQKGDEDGANYDPEAADNESPVREVRLSPFFLGKHEVTQGQWRAMTEGRDPSRYKAGETAAEKPLTPRNPVEQVSWEECDRWLSRNRLVLPTEAQWECACRAGTDTPWITGMEVGALGEVANIADAWLRGHGGEAVAVTPEIDDGHSVHAPVGSFAANAFGLHDVHGNVWEWCRDVYDPGGYPGGFATDPFVEEGSGDRVYRGGSWFRSARFARSTFRFWFDPADRSYDLGVRAARPLDKE